MPTTELDGSNIRKTLTNFENTQKFEFAAPIKINKDTFSDLPPPIVGSVTKHIHAQIR